MWTSRYLEPFPDSSSCIGCCFLLEYRWILAYLQGSVWLSFQEVSIDSVHAPWFSLGPSWVSCCPNILFTVSDTSSWEHCLGTEEACLHWGGLSALGCLSVMGCLSALRRPVCTGKVCCTGETWLILRLDHFALCTPWSFHSECVLSSNEMWGVLLQLLLLNCMVNLFSSKDYEASTGLGKCLFIKLSYVELSFASSFCAS